MSKKTIRYLYHVTGSKELLSILVEGIDPSYSRGLPLVWLVTRNKLGWAVRHTLMSHKRLWDEVRVLRIAKATVKVGLSIWRTGLFTSDEVIPPDKIGKVYKLRRMKEGLPVEFLSC